MSGFLHTNLSVSKIGPYIKVSLTVLDHKYWILPVVISHSQCYFSWVLNSPFWLKYLFSFHSVFRFVKIFSNLSKDWFIPDMLGSVTSKAEMAVCFACKFHLLVRPSILQLRTPNYWKSHSPVIWPQWRHTLQTWPLLRCFRKPAYVKNWNLQPCWEQNNFNLGLGY